jgi:hypothetical protein
LETCILQRIARFGRRLSRRHALQATLAAGGLALVGCSSGVGQSTAPVDESLLAWPDEDRWPEMFLASSERIQETYRFAVANQDVLQWMPCFCGCGEWGHTSNASCYVQEARGDGSVLLDSMSFG